METQPVERRIDLVHEVAEMRDQLRRLETELRGLIAFLRSRGELLGVLMVVLITVDIWGVPEAINDLARQTNNPEGLKAVGAAITAAVGLWLNWRRQSPPEDEALAELRRKLIDLERRSR